MRAGSGTVVLVAVKLVVASVELAEPGFEDNSPDTARRMPLTTPYGVNGIEAADAKTGASIASVFPSAIFTPPGHEPFSPPDGYCGTARARAYPPVVVTTSAIDATGEAPSTISAYVEPRYVASLRGSSSRTTTRISAPVLSTRNAYVPGEIGPTLGTCVASKYASVAPEWSTSAHAPALVSCRVSATPRNCSGGRVRFARGAVNPAETVTFQSAASLTAGLAGKTRTLYVAPALGAGGAANFAPVGASPAETVCSICVWNTDTGATRAPSRLAGAETASEPAARVTLIDAPAEV